MTVDGSSDTHAAEIGTGQRFRFGVNWTRLLAHLDEGRILAAEESLLQAIVCGAEGVVVSGLGRAGKAFEETLTPRALGEYRGSRGRKGRVLEPRRKDPSLSLPRVAPKTGA